MIHLPTLFLFLFSSLSLEKEARLTKTPFRSRHTPLPSVKAVIVGQDPYHNVNQAHGLAFSVRPPTPAPPSLRNMYTALKNDYGSFRPPPRNTGLLTPWADRGVLMLNTCLTVRAHQANSHANKGWERFTQKVIDVVARLRPRGVVFLAWGSPAQKRVAKVDRRKHLVLQSVHPSPLSASRGFVSSLVSLLFPTPTPVPPSFIQHQAPFVNPSHRCSFAADSSPAATSRRPTTGCGRATETTDPWTGTSTSKPAFDMLRLSGYKYVYVCMKYSSHVSEGLLDPCKPE